MKKLLAILLVIAAFSLNVAGQSSLATQEIRGVTFVKPSLNNLIKMVEMSSSDWVKACERINYTETSPYTTARPGYLLMNKGDVYKEGSSHLSKMGNTKVIYEWYYKGDDKSSIYRDALMELDKYFVRERDGVLLYQVTSNGKKYDIIHMSGGSQSGFMIERKN